MNLTKQIKTNETIEGFSFLFPFGCSILISETKEKISYNKPILTSGSLTFPVNETLICIHDNPKSGGRIMLSGSYKLFTDKYINKEENKKLIDLVFDLERKLTCKITNIPEKRLKSFKERKPIPSIEKLSQNLKSAIETNPDLSTNIFSLFENNLFKVHFDLQREAVKLHKKLNVERKSLTLISPVFETPMLGLTPAVFPPVLIDIDAPGLELYDLDDEFANPR